MADGYAQATGGPAAVNVHVQPGLANAMSGILNAARCRVPLLVTVGQQEQDLLPGDPFLAGELVGMARPLAKGAWEVAPPRGPAARCWREAVRTALRAAARAGRAEPAARRPGRARAAAARPRRARPSRRRRTPAPLDRAAALLAAARGPPCWPATRVAHAGAGAALGALAERLGAPIRGEPLAATVPAAHRPPALARAAAALRGRDRPAARAPRRGPGRRHAGVPALRPQPGRAPCRPRRRSCTWRTTRARSARSTRPPSASSATPALGLAGLLERLGPPPPEAARRRAREMAAAADARRGGARPRRARRRPASG